MVFIGVVFFALPHNQSRQLESGAATHYMSAAHYPRFRQHVSQTMLTEIFSGLFPWRQVPRVLQLFSFLIGENCGCDPVAALAFLLSVTQSLIGTYVVHSSSLTRMVRTVCDYCFAWPAVGLLVLRADLLDSLSLNVLCRMSACT